MAYENYTLRQFEKAWFYNDRSVMTEDVFNQVYSEYIDTSEMYDAEEFERVSYISFLNSRINYINLFISTQKDFLRDFQVPYRPAFQRILEKYGYFLLWKDDKNDFLKQLEKIEFSEKKYISILNTKIVELNKLRESKKIKSGNEDSEEVKLKKQNEIYKKTINTLGKIGYPINQDVTTVQEFSLMIKQQKEENKTNN